MIPLYEANEFMKRRIQLLNSEGVLRVRELRIKARTLLPAVSVEECMQYDQTLKNMRQISINLEFLLDMFQVDPLPSVSTEIKPVPPEGVA